VAKYTDVYVGLYLLGSGRGGISSGDGAVLALIRATTHEQPLWTDSGKSDVLLGQLSAHKNGTF